MDEIVDTPGSTTPFEKARNRVAGALFVVCLFVAACILLVHGPAREFEREETSLQQTHQYWVSAKERSALMHGNWTTFFEPALHDLLLSACVTPEEMSEFLKRKYLPTGYGIVDYAPISYVDWTSRSGSSSNCAKGYEHPSLYIEVKRAATALGHLPVSKSGYPDTQAVLRTLKQTLNPAEVELIRQHFSDDSLVGIVQGWWAWPTQRRWLASSDGLSYKPGKLKERYVEKGTYFDSSTIRLAPRGLGSRLAKQLVQEDGLDQARLQSALRFAEAEQVIDDAYGRAKQAHQSHTVSSAVSQLQLGGLSVTFTQAVKLALPAIALLMVLFVIYSDRVERDASVSTSVFWFPRLDQPADPFARPWPRNHDWLARGLWLVHLTLPIALAYCAVWTGFALEDFGKVDSLSAGSSIADWFNALLFLLVWWCTIEISTTKGQLSRRHGHWMLWAVTVTITVFIIGGGLIGAAKGFFVVVGADGARGYYHTAPWANWSSIMQPTYWLLPAIWLFVAWRHPRVSRFAFVLAVLMTAGVALGFGSAVALTWHYGLS